MKLTYFQVEAHLTKHLLPVYLISGDDVFLKQEVSSWIRKAAKNAGFSERIRKTPSVNSDWEELYTLFYSHSLLQEKRLLELDCKEHHPNSTAGNLLTEYANRISTDLILIIDMNKLDAKSLKQTWFQALEKIGAHIAVWPIPHEQLPTWILNRAKKYKLSLQTDAAKFLADFVEGNLSAAAQALEKIFLLRPDTIIDQTLLSNILNDESQFTIFDLTEVMLTNHKEKILRVLHHLQQEGIEPTLVLWAITRELRLLAHLTSEIKQGATYDSLFQKYKIFARRAIILRQYLSHHPVEHYWQLLSLATQVDKIIKGISLGKPWDALQSLCLKLV